MTWPFLALVLVTGCDFAFGLDTLEVKPDGPPVDGPPPLADTSIPPCLADTFGASAIDTLIWRLVVPTNQPTVVTQEDGHLVITLAPESGAYNGIESNGVYDMVDGSISAEVVQLSSQLGSTETSLAIRVDAGTSYLMAVYEQLLRLEIEVDDDRDFIEIAFDARQDVFWRIRQSSATTVELETSPDGAVYQSKRTVGAPKPLSAVSFSFYAGTYSMSNAAVGVAEFDNVELRNETCLND